MLKKVRLLTVAAAAGTALAGFAGLPSVALAASSSQSSCMGTLSSGLGAGAGGTFTRSDLAHLVKAHAAIEGVAPGQIISSHAQDHSGSFAACLAS